MSDSRLYDHNIQIDRTQLIPTQQDEFSATWANKISQQQVRAIGKAGSYVFDVPAGVSEYSITSPRYYLSGWYNSSNPPMIFAMPQYGSAIIYKQFQDSNNEYVSPTSPLFRTYIKELRYDSGGQTWSFVVQHDVRVVSWVYFYSRIFPELTRSWYPALVPSLVQASDPRPEMGALHWYAMGIAP